MEAKGAMFSSALELNGPKLVRLTRSIGGSDLNRVAKWRQEWPTLITRGDNGL